MVYTFCEQLLPVYIYQGRRVLVHCSIVFRMELYSLTLLAGISINLPQVTCEFVGIGYHLRIDIGCRVSFFMGWSGKLC